MQKNHTTAQTWQQARHFLYQLSVAQFPCVYDVQPNSKSRYRMARLTEKMTEAKAAVQRGKELRRQLFIEFCNTQLRSNFNLYVEDKTTPEQRRAGWGDHGYTPAFERTLYQLQAEFTQLRIAKIPTPDYYLTHCLDDTPLVLLLKEFDQEVGELEKNKEMGSPEYIEGVAMHLLNQVNTHCIKDEWPQSAIRGLMAILIEQVNCQEQSVLLLSDTHNTGKKIVGVFKRVAAPYLKPSLVDVDMEIIEPAPVTSPSPDSNEQDIHYGVYAVAAMCYYLEKAEFLTKFESRNKFIKDALIPKYSFTISSISNKCSQMKKNDFREQHKGAIRKAIVLMETTEEFDFSKAILLARADCA